MSVVKKIKMKDRFEICPGCGYENGFHIILVDESKTGRSSMKIQLKCPSCARIYDLDIYCTAKA